MKGIIVGIGGARRAVWRQFAAVAAGDARVVGLLKRRLVLTDIFCSPVGAKRHPSTEARHQESDKIVKLPAQPEELDCPEVEIDGRRRDGARRRRHQPGRASSVRYHRRGARMRSAGRAIRAEDRRVGPSADRPGRARPAPIRRRCASSEAREDDQKLLYEKTFTVAANTDGGVQAPFHIVTDPILLPLTRARLDDDYSITVGLGAGGAPLAHPHHRGAKQTG